MRRKRGGLMMSNIEDDMYEIKKLQEILIFYKNHGWIPNIDRTIDIEKSLQAINNQSESKTKNS